MNHRKKIARIALGSLFLAQTGMAGAICCDDPMTAASGDVSFAPLASADIRIKVKNPARLGQNEARFDIREKDVNPLQYVFAKTLGLYMPGSLNNEETCPRINLPDDYFEQEKMGDGIVRVTLRASHDLIDLVESHGCVITNRPKLIF